MLKRTRQTFIVSDLHFSHANIIRYCNRPYEVEPGNKNPKNAPAIAAMNEDILKMFDFLPDDCDIWNLGDFYFTGSGDPKKIDEKVVETLKQIVTRLKKNNRRLFIVLGNHDKMHRQGQSITQFYYELGFDRVYDTPVLIEDKYILSHEPVYTIFRLRKTTLHSTTKIMRWNVEYLIRWVKLVRLLQRVIQKE